MVGICRQLDGIPLAIELAAARAAVLGVAELAARLDDRFGLLTGGRRTALPRHQTLRATLDWSHGLLDEPERVILRRLPVFAGSFSLSAATAVATCLDVEPWQVVDGSPALSRSRLSQRRLTAAPRNTACSTPRAYALAKLDESGERDGLARRHAEHYRVLFERAKSEWGTRPKAQWLAEYRRHIDNLRASLDWAFSPTGDSSIGVAITVASVKLRVQLSMMAECRRHVERALGSLSDRGSRGEMQLQAALGLSLNYTRRRTQGKEAALTRTWEIAESLGDTEYQLLALRGLWAWRVDTGAYRMALALAERFTELAAAAGETAYMAIGDRMAGIALFVLGDLSRGAPPHGAPSRATLPAASAFADRAFSDGPRD